MALYFPLSKQIISIERPLRPGYAVTAEGQALVNYNGTVYPAEGVAGEEFVGFAVAQHITMANFPKIEVAQVVNADYTVKLARVPVAGSLLVLDEETGEAITPASTAEDVVTLSAAQQGKYVKFQYTYVPSYAEAVALKGNIIPGGPAALATGTVGVISTGDVYTTEFDTSVDWSQVKEGEIKLGANGRLVTSGEGVATKLRVVSLPTSSQPYLGVYVNV